MNAESIRIECDEDGFHLILQLDEEIPLVTNEGRLNVRLMEPEALYDSVKAEIGPWLYERDQAHAEFRQAVERGVGPALAIFRCNPDESAGADEGYELNDPKGPKYHSTHADIWDAREKGLI